ncbi:DUF881 domain-containing protein [Enemella evansiae]|uniref:DUF881 domain-containing protein n=1 Tax=Enemella evansiae TaxID=2016499 RepID=UPI001E4620C4|nr:DUF881 domain-containing protein [Enemella evansiae]
MPENETPEQPETEDTSPVDEQPKRAATAEPSGWARLGRAFLRPGRGQLVVAVICCVVAMAVVMQIRAQRTDDTYATARRADLVQLVDGLGQESRRLEAEVNDLERSRRDLTSGADSQRVARDEARRRLDALQVLSGTAPAEGPGVLITITDPNQKVTVGVVLDAIEEMRDAGAEVIEVNDRIRLVASSSITGNPGALEIDGQPVTMPLTLKVIGEPNALDEAARFRGGLASEITSAQIGGQITIERQDRLQVRSLHVPQPHQYAQPAR